MLKQIAQATNAAKAQLIVTVNELVALLVAFHVVLTQTQLAAIDGALNAVFALYVALTYTQSSKRVDPPAPAPEPTKP